MALPVAMLNAGCSSADAAGNDNGARGTDGEEYASTEDALRSKKPKPPPCEDAGPAKPKPKTCEQVLASAFPGPDEYQWDKVAQSKEVVACCDEELTKNGASSTHRWSCCVAYDPTVDAGNDGFNTFGPGGHGAACTPWGPPVPPSMARGRRANPAIAAWVARARNENEKAVA